MRTVLSINNVTIRLTSERWEHIVENHPEIAGRLERVLEANQNSDYILKGE